MKLLRVWLLLLLAALLPIRGAMAASWLCPPAVETHGQERMVAEAHHGHDRADGHGHAMHEAGPAQGHHDGTGHDRCSHCASCCAMVPLMSSFAHLPQPLGTTGRFPELSVAAPSFVSAGQERPPRSL